MESEKIKKPCKVVGLEMLEEDETNKYKEFCLYFDELDNQGINWGKSDLRRKAKELGLPILDSDEKVNEFMKRSDLKSKEAKKK